MSDEIKIVLSIFGTIILLVLIGLIIDFATTAKTSVLSPIQNKIQYNTFKQSQTYKDGMAQTLDKYRIEYASASQEGKDAIKSTIQHDFSNFNSNELSSEDQQFLHQMLN
jgi:hypothetical protein